MSGWDNAPEYGGKDPDFWSVTLSIALFVAVCAGAAWLSLSSARGQPHEGSYELSGAASVIDGDTLEIHGQRIRLWGIDAPERGARCGQDNVARHAALALADAVAARTVRCTIVGSDRFDRAVGICSAGDDDLAAQMTRIGWARDWPRYSEGAYADEEELARASGRGLWALQCPADLWRGRDYSR